jgi:hypothetical protein
MPATIPVPNGVYQLGSQVYGPATLAASDSQVLVQLDRTVAQGMNAKPVTTTVRALFEMQFPGDPAWYLQGDCSFQGGIRSDPETGQLNTDVFGCSLSRNGVTGRALRLTVTVAGSSVRLGGTLTVS